MDLGIAGKRALVLGASKGLGAASARALLEEGVEVHTISRSGTAPGPGMTALAANLSQADGVQRVIEHVTNVGQIDILVANSGGPRPGPDRAWAVKNGKLTSLQWLSRSSGLPMPSCPEC